MLFVSVGACKRFERSLRRGRTRFRPPSPRKMARGQVLKLECHGSHSSWGWQVPEGWGVCGHGIEDSSDARPVVQTEKVNSTDEQPLHVSVITLAQPIGTQRQSSGRRPCMIRPTPACSSLAKLRSVIHLHCNLHPKLASCPSHSSLTCGLEAIGLVPAGSTSSSSLQSAAARCLFNTSWGSRFQSLQLKMTVGPKPRTFSAS